MGNVELITEEDHESWIISLTCGREFKFIRIPTTNMFKSRIELVTMVDIDELIELHRVLKFYVDYHKYGKLIDFLPVVLQKQIRDTNLNSV